jgi:hypothetical protein
MKRAKTNISGAEADMAVWLGKDETTLYARSSGINGRKTPIMTR